MIRGKTDNKPFTIHPQETRPSEVRSDALLEAFDRIRDAAVKAFASSRPAAQRDPIGKIRTEREFDVLFGVIQDEKRKASNALLAFPADGAKGER